MKKIYLAFLLGACSVFASPLLDQEYSYKGFVAAVVNSTTEPIHAEKVEEALVQALRGTFRYDFSDEAQLKLKAALRQLNVPEIGEATAAKMDFIRPILKQLSTEGVAASVLAEINRVDDLYSIRMYLVTNTRADVVYQLEEKVDTAYSLDAFARAAKTGVARLVRGIPFDGTVISRDGFRVVLDRGKGTLYNGMQIPVFTIELVNGNIVFEETGVIALTRVEDTLSFGRILVEKKPLEISAGNKLRLTDKLVADFNPDLLPEENLDRAPAMNFSEFEVTKGQIGRLNADFGWTMVNYTNEQTNGRLFDSTFGYPTANVNGELWFTSRFFMDANYRHSVSRFANNPRIVGDTNTSSTSFRMQFGYRMNILAPDPGPILYTKIGYGRDSYSFEHMVEPLLFTGISYGGMLLTGGMKVPVTDTWGLGFEINTMIFPSAGEERLTSGATIDSVSSWDLTFRSYIGLAPDMDVEIRAMISNSSTGFTGRGTRTDSLKKYSQSAKGLQFGLSYYF